MNRTQGQLERLDKLAKALEFLEKWSPDDKGPARAAVRDPYGRKALTRAQRGEIEALEPKSMLRPDQMGGRRWVEFIKRFAYDTNAIEGSSLSRAQVERMMVEGYRGPGTPEIAEAICAALAMERIIYRVQDHVTLDLMRELHRISFRESWLICGRGAAGEFRPEGVEMCICDSSTGRPVRRCAPSRRVVPGLEALVGWYEQRRHEYPAIALAATVHDRFEMIHPFRDGNGRVGRLLLNNVLMKNGLPPVNIRVESRRDYYYALNAYAEKGDILPTARLISREYEAMESCRALRRE